MILQMPKTLSQLLSLWLIKLITAINSTKFKCLKCSWSSVQDCLEKYPTLLYITKIWCCYCYQAKRYQILTVGVPIKLKQVFRRGTKRKFENAPLSKCDVKMKILHAHKFMIQILLNTTIIHFIHSSPPEVLAPQGQLTCFCGALKTFVWESKRWI